MLLRVFGTCVASSSSCHWTTFVAAELFELDFIDFLLGSLLHIHGVYSLLLLLGAHDDSSHGLLRLLLHIEVIGFIEVKKVAV